MHVCGRRRIGRAIRMDFTVRISIRKDRSVASREKWPGGIARGNGDRRLTERKRQPTDMP